MSAARLIFAAQALRGLAYGLAAVQLATLLRAEGLQAAGVGLVLAAVMAGGALASIALGRWGDRFGRRRSYAVLYLALALCGSLIAAGAPVWLLSLAALSGALSVEVVESGPFTTVEQVLLDGSGVAVRGFGLYNAVAAIAGTAGALLGALPPARSLLGGVLLAVGVAGALLALRLPAALEVASVQVSAPVRPRPVVVRLAALFAVDSLAGGFVVQAYLAYWLGVHYQADTASIGLLFAGCAALQTASFLLAPVIAARIGLLNTMVFTHLPSNLLLVGVAFAPGFPVAAGLLLARACLSSMDVPTRQAYVMAMVPPTERTTTAAVTNTARSLTRPAGPVLAGLLQPLGLAWPFLIAGTAKTLYDLALWRIFRRLELPTEDPS
ncbi:MFS transporter [Nonomuraea zeae]|uniref:MFS transporter n=1 Tax=Nonomuraea zeae TaxID=1642303 RepID=A0A5S4GXE4_9ACTN|nr:MFS transporter [Nonomuraea zeae]TMR37479.1 MFS transporter [Nonomuraea zeae]